MLGGLLFTSQRIMNSTAGSGSGSTKPQRGKGKKKSAKPAPKQSQQKSSASQSRRQRRQAVAVQRKNPPRPTPSSMASKIQSKIAGLLSSPELQSAALAVMLPERCARGPIDQVRAGGCTALECTQLQCSFNADLFALYTLLIGASTRPEVNSPDGEGIPLFPSGSVPVIHFHDPCCPFMMPCSSATAPGVGNPRVWRFTTSSNPTEKITPTTTMSFVYDMVPRSLPVAAGGDAYKFPSDFRTRPIARQRTTVANQEYFWVDACAASPTGVNMTVDIALGSTVAITTGNVTVSLVTILLGSDGLEQRTTLPGQTVVFTLNGTTGKYEASVAVTDLVSTSGWYRLAVVLTFPIINGSTTYTQMTIYGRAELQEFVRIGTGFFIDPNFSSLTALALRYWHSASAALVSFRSPPLTAGGSIYGVNLRPWKEWTQPLALGDGAARGQAPVGELANGMQGYNLIDGIYVWEKVSVAPASLLDTSVDLAFVPSVSVVERPPLAYLIGCSGAFDGGSLLSFDPSASQTGATVVMRFEHTSLLAYQPRNKIIKPTNGPVFLLPDQMTALQHVLLSIPNFSENDWHDVFIKAANVAFKMAKYIVYAAEAVGGNPISAVSLAKEVATDWRKFVGDRGESTAM